MQNIYNSVKSGGLKVFIGAGKKCRRIKNHVLGCRILDSSSEGVKIPGPINFWWFWSCCICVTVTVHHFSSIQVLYRPLRPKWAIPPPITIQNMRFYEMMIIWQTVPLNILHKSFLHFYTTWLDKQKSMRAKRGVGCVQIQIQLQWRLLPIPLDLVLFWQIHTPVLLGLEVIFYSRTVAEKGMLFVWKLWRRKNKKPLMRRKMKTRSRSLFFRTELLVLTC